MVLCRAGTPQCGKCCGSGSGDTTDLPALPRSEARGTQGELEMTLSILKALSNSV